MSLDDDLQFDLHALELECQEQPLLYMKYSQIYQEAIAEADKAKERLDLIKAELAHQARTDKEVQDDIGKVTVDAINDWVVRQPEYQEATEEYQAAKFESGMAGQAVRAFDQRKKMLELSVQMWAGEYFAGPRIPKEVMAGKRGLAEQSRKKSEKKQNEQMKSKRRRK